MHPTPPAIPTAVLERLPTPCLVVDVAACERNIRRAAGLFTDARAKLRPHFKAHKCVTVMRRQLAAGGCVGVTCATAAEAETLADSGFDDILVANQIVHRAGLGALARAARRSRITVAIDDLAHVSLLRDEAERSSVRFEVVIEIDVGMSRCGIAPGSDTLEALADAVATSAALELRGLQGYEGHAVLRPSRDERRELVRHAGAILANERSRLQARGHRCSIVSGGGTGTIDLVTEVGVLDEVQAGSYALMDASYGSLDLPFENALFVAATVISHPRPGLMTINAGLKAVSAEYGMPVAVADDLEILELSDEHATASVGARASVAIGAPVFLVPAHVDPTINLHDVLFAWDGVREALDVWPVEGRRAEAGEALAI